MHPFPLPTQIEIKEKSHNEGTLIVYPCYPGYGTTLGNALRRVMLSSLEGAAVVAIKIKGVLHEFSTIPYVKEDVIEIILNLKQLRLKILTIPQKEKSGPNENSHSADQEELMKNSGSLKLYLRAKGIKEVKAGDIEKNPLIEIINQDLHLATLTDEQAELEMEIIVEEGRGYEPTENIDKRKLEIGFIAVDAIFSPVRKISFKTERVRVGEMTNYDKLILEIETDGTLRPKEVITKASQILIDHFSLLLDQEKAAEKKEKVEKKKEGIKEEELKPTIDSVAQEEPVKKKRGRPKKIKNQKSK